MDPRYFSNRKDRQARAAELRRQAEGRTPADQLLQLDRRLGRGMGATKERAKIEEKLAKSTDR